PPSPSPPRTGGHGGREELVGLQGGPVRGAAGAVPAAHRLVRLLHRRGARQDASVHPPRGDHRPQLPHHPQNILGERSSVPTKEGWSVGCTALPPAVQAGTDDVSWGI
ncbi:Os10g0495600, partial [Oryza sativa Japonica Group]